MYDTIVGIIGDGMNEELSDELLTAWIKNRIKKVANNTVVTSTEIMDKFTAKLF